MKKHASKIRSRVVVFLSLLLLLCVIAIVFYNTSIKSKTTVSNSDLSGSNIETVNIENKEDLQKAVDMIKDLQTTVIDVQELESVESTLL